MNQADTYAHALVALVKQGKTPHQALKALTTHLGTRGRTGMLRPIQHALTRVAQENVRNQSVLEVAHERDAAAAKREAHALLGEVKFAVRENERLIGGWRAIDRHTLLDNSHRKHLLDIYKRITFTL